MVPRGLTRGAPTGGRGAASSLGGMNAAAVTAAQASGDELAFTTQALNPSLLGNVRIRLYVDGDANTPEKGLTIEYQPNLQQPIVRKMTRVGVGQSNLTFAVTDQLTFATNLSARGLTRTGTSWTRAGANAANPIKLSIDGNAASFTLDPNGGC